MSNGLTPAQTERFALVMEEMAEAQQVIGKILRHGLMSTHVDYDFIPNKELLEKELGHVGVAISLLMEYGDVSEEAMTEHGFVKIEKLGQFLHYNTVSHA